MRSFGITESQSQHLSPHGALQIRKLGEFGQPGQVLAHPLNVKAKHVVRGIIDKSIILIRFHIIAFYGLMAVVRAAIEARPAEDNRLQYFQRLARVQTLMDLRMVSGLRGGFRH